MVSNRVVERYSKFELSYIWDLSRLVVVNIIFIHLRRYLNLKKDLSPVLLLLRKYTGQLG